MAVAGTVAVMEVAVPAVTVSCVLPRYTVEPAVKLPLVSVVPATKFVPVTVMVVAAAPAVTEAGLTELMAGPFTVNVLAVDAAVLVFLTVRLCAPDVTRDVAGMVAVMEVAVPAVTINWVEPR